MNSISDQLSYSIRQKEKRLFKWSILNFDCGKEPRHVELPSSTFKFTGRFNFDVLIKIINWSCVDRCLQYTLPNVASATEIEIILKISGHDGKINKTAKNIISGALGGTFNVETFDKDRGCLISGNHITILLEVSVAYYENVENLEVLVKHSPHGCFKDLYTHKTHWDVNLVVAGNKLKAHKCILAGHSEVFNAMFEHDMKETNSNKVVINDIDFEVFNEMLRYIYTNEVLNLEQHASELLAASEKYNLKGLKRLCEAKLMDSLSIKTAVKTLIIADLFRAETLKKHAVSFINANRKSLSQTEDWKNLVTNHIHLVLQLFL